MPDAGEEVLAFPDTQARRLVGVSMRRLRYWEQVGLIVPSIKRRLSDHNTVRLYSYLGLLALLVVSARSTTPCPPNAWVISAAPRDLGVGHARARRPCRVVVACSQRQPGHRPLAAPGEFPGLSSIAASSRHGPALSDGKAPPT